MGHFVHALEKLNGLKIFTAAILIGNPLAGFARIIKIEHGSNGVYAEAVDVLLVESKESVGDQIILDLFRTVVVDERAPVRMSALPRVGVPVEMAAVELSEAVRVARKMRRSPVENDADVRLVAAVDKFHEFGGRTVAAGGSEIAQSLVAPGAVVRMLHDGEHLDVRAAEVFDVRNELVRKFGVGKPAILIFRNAAPRTEMDFVNRNGRLEPIFG